MKLTAIISVSFGGYERAVVGSGEEVIARFFGSLFGRFGYLSRFS